MKPSRLTTDDGLRTTDHWQTASDRGHDTDNVVILKGSLVLLEIADVFVIQVDVNETADFPVFGKEVPAQVSVARRDPRKRLSYGLRLDFYRILLPRILPQRSGNNDFNGHRELYTSISGGPFSPTLASLMHPA